MADGQSARVVESSVSQSVIEALASAERVDPVDLTPPLYDVVDPDALDKLFADPPAHGQRIREVVFTYKGYEVTVEGDGSVSVGSQDVEPAR